MKIAGLLSKPRWGVLLCATAACTATAADIQTADLNAKNASKFARNLQYSEAYREIGWLLSDPQPAVRQKAGDVLTAFPQLAAWRLSQITKQAVIASACETPTTDPRNTIKDTNETIVNLAAYSSVQALSAARAEVEAAQRSMQDRNWLAECSATADPITEEERHRIAEEARAAAEEAQRQAEQALRDEAAAAKRAAVVLLREYDRLEFCSAYGDAVREDVRYPFSSVPSYRQLFEAEAARRKITISRTVIKAETMHIGMDQCTLYASWGTPHRQNRSVGPWGIHLQLIYGDHGPYVYLKNGIVTSFQD